MAETLVDYCHVLWPNIDPGMMKFVIRETDLIDDLGKPRFRAFLAPEDCWLDNAISGAISNTHKEALQSLSHILGQAMLQAVALRDGLLSVDQEAHPQVEDDREGDTKDLIERQRCESTIDTSILDRARSPPGQLVRGDPVIFEAGLAVYVAVELLQKQIQRQNQLAAESLVGLCSASPITPERIIELN